MTAKKSKTTPDKRRKYDEAFKAEARRDVVAQAVAPVDMGWPR